MALLNKNKGLIYLIYILHLIIFTFGNLFIMNNDVKIIFNLACVVSLQLLILMIFKLDFIFFLTFLMTYLLCPSILVYYNMETKNLGLISLNKVNIYLNEISIYIYVFIFVISFLSFLFQFQKKEEKLLNSYQFKLRDITIFINNILIYVFTIVSFPRLGMTSQDRFDMLLPGNAWNQFVIVLILFNLPYITKKKSVMCSTLFAILWFSLNGERADIAGLALGVMIMAILSNKIRKKTKLLSVAVFFLFFLIYIAVGEIRVGAYSSFRQLFTDIGTFSTVSDISYLLSVSVDYVNNFGHTNGLAMLNIIKCFIPFGSRPGINVFIDKYYADPGGIPLIAPMIIDGGLRFIAFVSTLLSGLLFLLTKMANNNKFFRMEFIVLICSIPRICWYGIYYIGPSCIFFVPFIYILDNLLNGKSENK